MWDVRTWTTCVTHQVGHICHIFSTHLSHIFSSNLTIQSDEHGPILRDYITSLQYVRCSYMAHMCDTSDGTYMPHIYNTYCTHLLLQLDYTIRRTCTHIDRLYHISSTCEMFVHGPHVLHIRWAIHVTHLAHIYHTFSVTTWLYNTIRRTWTHIGRLYHISSTCEMFLLDMRIDWFNRYDSYRIENHPMRYISFPYRLIYKATCKTCTFWLIFDSPFFY